MKSILLSSILAFVVVLLLRHSNPENCALCDLVPPDTLELDPYHDLAIS